MSALKLPVHSISRIRIQTDGQGVTSLVASMGCHLRCKLCFNASTWNGKAKKWKEYSTEELYEELKIDDLYFQATGGGVMFGGGEPLLHSSFHRAFMEEYKDAGWTFNFETSLHVPEENLRDVMHRADFFLVDTKDMDPERYRAYTGGDFGLFRENLSLLLREAGPEAIRVRVPQIMNFHKGDEAKENARILEEMGFTQIEIFSYVDPVAWNNRKKKPGNNE